MTIFKSDLASYWARSGDPHAGRSAGAAASFGELLERGHVPHAYARNKTLSGYQIDVLKSGYSLTEAKVVCSNDP